MANEKLAQLIEKEEKLLNGYRKKRAEYDAKIKRSEGKLQQYQMMQRSEQFTEVSAVIAQNGLSMEDILNALQTGNLMGLKEKMEAAEYAVEAEDENDIPADDEYAVEADDAE